MNLSRTTDPSVEPVTAAEVEEKLVISSGWNSTTYTRQISAARDQIERMTDRSLITQSWTLKLDKWPENEAIHLPKGDVQSITTFTYVNGDGDVTALVADTDYYLSNNGDDTRLIPVTSWPSVLTTKNDVILVEYVTGYGDAATDIPDWATESIVALVEWLYSSGENQGAYECAKMIAKPNKVFFNYRIND